MRQLKITNRITARESVSLDKYLQDISKIPLLSPEEETSLARQIKEGDSEALQKLIESNLRFVVSVSKQYQNQGLSLSDLINEGNLGLIKAANRFDETRGFKFISYAVWWIRQSILQAIVEHSRIVRLPLNKVSAYNKVMDAFQSFVQDFEREPSSAELSELLNIPEKDVDMLLKSSKHVSFDAPVGNEEDSTSLLEIMSMEDEVSPDVKLMEESVQTEVSMGLSLLSPRELHILEGFYGLKGKRALSLEELARENDLTKERVRQIRDRALGRLRKSYSIKTFMGLF
jgi:RNA polymerase primary sigma factor